MKVNFRSVRFRIYAVLIATGLVVYYFSIPDPLFKDPYSTVLQAHGGELLSASIASDGQWRFPQHNKVPDKFAQSIIAFEDKRFYNHPGVDLLSLGRALRQNIKDGRIVSGGSTISMQVIRLARKEKERTILEKAIEIILATRLELRYSKEEILALYAAHAPFGGNVVGLEAACWRYFGQRSADLSWSEAALLAVLPNAPALIHPGKNRILLLHKRDRLLDRLQQMGIIDAFTCELAKEESIPEEPKTLPRLASHLLTRIAKEGSAGRVMFSTIDFNLQQRVEQILQDHQQRLQGNRIYNASAIVAEINTGNVLAYAGNVRNAKNIHGDDVDVIMSPRSTGSILKPFLYAAMLDEGKILPQTILPDVPIYISGFSPKNFSKEYDGAVPADKALIRSLNVPAVHLLREYRYEKFHTLLRELGMTTLTQPPDHYGLSLILGGAEGTLWDIAGMYASMARSLKQFFRHPGKNKYDRKDFHPLRYSTDESRKDEQLTHILEETSFLSAGAIYQTFDALKEVNRPGEDSGWRQFFSARKIAWKTGTSFGFRDGWAIGVTPDHVVGIWVGNADGEGRPGLTGTDGAAPILFDVFSQLTGNEWFPMPQTEMETITVCAKSGHRNTAFCNETDTVFVLKAGLESGACPYHRKVHVTPDKRYRVHSQCAPLSSSVAVNWFVLPPVQEYYFQPHNITYHPLPPLRQDCRVASPLASSMDVIYPKSNARLFIPRSVDGKAGSAVFQFAHRNETIAIFWHLDGEFVGTTRKTHQLALNPKEGPHKLSLVDENGETFELAFEVLSKM